MRTPYNYEALLTSVEGPHNWCGQAHNQLRQPHNCLGSTAIVRPSNNLEAATKLCCCLTTLILPNFAIVFPLNWTSCHAHSYIRCNVFPTWRAGDRAGKYNNIPPLKTWQGYYPATSGNGLGRRLRFAM